MKCLHAASEVAGFAKTGGLADVVGALPIALKARGIECAVIMPLYRACRSSKQTLTPTEHRFRLPIGERVVEGRLWQSALPGSDVPVYLIEQPEFFDRDDSGQALYQFTNSAGDKIDHPDNSARFGFFARAILEAMRLLDYWPDVLHLHDWQTGLAGVYLRELYLKHAKPDLRDHYASIRTIFTIHNLAYQGTFWHLDVPMLGLPWRLFTMDQLEFHEKLNFLKAGLVYADLLTTVSPTYAREIQTTMYGCGLHGVLMQRSDRLHGIVNGIDDHVWNPKSDGHLVAKFDAASVSEQKPRCKGALQRHFGLEPNPRTPLLGIVSRLAQQKGFDLIEKVIPEFMQKGVQLAVLGDGEKIYRDMLLKLREDFPRQVGLHVGYSDPIAHQIEAGADIFLMPSRYEPCGLNQIYSLKYGTAPVVRATGGLDDTVEPFDAVKLSGTGFKFSEYSAAAMMDAIRAALGVYRSPKQWKQLMLNGMKQDFSWSASAAQYARLYEGLRDSRRA